jgi:hypothetical protein
MENVIALYDKLVLHKITCESNHAAVTAQCELIRQGRSMRTSFLITYTDLNRIIAKITAQGYEFDMAKQSLVRFDDGTEIIDYQFDQVFGGPVTLEGFEFANTVTEIRA